MIGESIDAGAGLFGVNLDECGIGTVARELHHVVEEGFGRIGVIFWKRLPTAAIQPEE